VGEVISKDIYVSIWENILLYVKYVRKCLLNVVPLRNITICILENIHFYVIHVGKPLSSKLTLNAISMCIINNMCLLVACERGFSKLDDLEQHWHVHKG